MPYIVGKYKFKEPVGDNGYANQLQECADRNKFQLTWKEEPTRDATGIATTCMTPFRKRPMIPRFCDQIQLMG